MLDDFTMMTIQSHLHSYIHTSPCKFVFHHTKSRFGKSTQFNILSQPISLLFLIEAVTHFFKALNVQVRNSKWSVSSNCIKHQSRDVTKCEPDEQA